MTNDYKTEYLPENKKKLEDFFQIVGEKVVLKGTLETDNFIRNSRGVRVNRDGVNASSVSSQSSDSGGTTVISGSLQHTGSTVGFYNETPVAQASAIGQLTNSTGGTPGSTLSATGPTDTIDQSAVINNNFASLLAKVNAIELALKNIGISA